MLRAGVLLLLVVGCGGRAREHTLGGEAQGGAGAADGGSSEQARGGVSDGGADAAIGGTRLVSNSGGAESQAGAPPDEPPIGSGTRYCENETYCFGLACYVPEHLYDRVCVSDCETNDDCGEHETCLASPELRGSCYRVCEQTSDCLYGFDCFDFTKQHEQLVCFPTKWAEYWRTHAL